MEKYLQKIDVRWSDLDANFHVRHSAYYDYGAYVRMCFLQEHGITAQFMQQHGFGPILLREECIFRREIRMEDKVTIDLKLAKATAQYKRWTIQHHIYKDNEVLAAVITVDGAWLDTIIRKIALPPAAAQETFLAMPTVENFIIS